MSLFARLRRTNRPGPQAPREAPRWRPRLELLEDRAVPAIIVQTGDVLRVTEIYFKETTSGQFKAGNIVLRVQEPSGRVAYFDDPANTPVPNSGGRIVTTPSGARFQRSNQLNGSGTLVSRVESYQFDPPLRTGVPAPSGDYEARAVYESSDGGRADRTGVTFSISPTAVPADFFQLLDQPLTLGGEISAAFTVPPRTGDIEVRSAGFVSGDTLQYTYQTTGTPGPFEVGVFRSADSTFDASDVLVGTPVTVSPGPAGQPNTESLTVSDPNDPLWRDEARPYVLVVADPYGTVTESNESNNAAAFQPPPYSAPGEVFDDVLLPEVQLPINLPKPALSVVNLDFAPLAVRFTTQPSSQPGAVCTAQSDPGTLHISVVQPTLGLSLPIANSTGRATVTIFGGPQPYVHWHTDNFHAEPAPPFDGVPVSYDSGPITIDVPLSDLGLTLATPFGVTLRTAEAYIHRSLSQRLPYVSTLLSSLLVLQDPGSTDLLVTSPSGQQTGRRADGTVVTEIPFSAYLPNEPVVLVFAPQPGSYETDVRGRAPGSYEFVTGLVTNLSTPAGVQDFVGTLGDGQTVVYSTRISPGGGPVTAVDVGRTLDLFPLFIDRLQQTGAITNRGVANSLQSKLANARRELLSGHAAAARGMLGAFINEVHALRGKQIAAHAAGELDAFATFLLGYVA